MLAGHETTAQTTSWILYELAKNHEVQSRLRDEVKAIRAQAAYRGDEQLSIADLDSMKYLLAVIKVSKNMSMVPVWFTMASRIV